MANRYIIGPEKWFIKSINAGGAFVSQNVITQNSQYPYMGLKVVLETSDSLILN